MQGILDRARVDTVLRVSVAERMEVAAELIGTMPGVMQTQLHDGHIRVQTESRGLDPSQVAEKLLAAGFRLTRLDEEKVDLETAFMRLTEGLTQ